MQVNTGRFLQNTEKKAQRESMTENINNREQKSNIQKTRIIEQDILYGRIPKLFKNKIEKDFPLEEKCMLNERDDQTLEKLLKRSDIQNKAGQILDL